MPSNLPTVNTQDSAAATRLFFDIYGEAPLEFNANDVDAALGFFLSKGFEENAAVISAAALLKQAKIERIPVFQIIDSLGKTNNIKLSAIVGEILNNDRPATSILGYKDRSVIDDSQSRNIGA